MTNICVRGGSCRPAAYFKLQLCVVLCPRCDGPAEGAAFRLPGLRGSYASRPPQQQAGQPGTHLQALEVEEKEKREAQAKFHRYNVQADFQVHVHKQMHGNIREATSAIVSLSELEGNRSLGEVILQPLRWAAQYLPWGDDQTVLAGFTLTRVFDSVLFFVFFTLTAVLNVFPDSSKNCPTSWMKQNNNSAQIQNILLYFLPREREMAHVLSLSENTNMLLCSKRYKSRMQHQQRRI